MELWLLKTITTLFVTAARLDCFLGNQTCMSVRNILFKSGLLVDGGLEEVMRSGESSRRMWTGWILASGLADFQLGYGQQRPPVQKASGCVKH